MYDEKYLVNSEDIEISGEFVPATSESNSITPLIDGEAYFASVLEEMNKLIHESSTGTGGGFFYLHNWWFQTESISDLAVINIDNPNTVWNEGSPVTGSSGYDPFYFDAASTISLKDKLEELANIGIDVRILVWTSPIMLSTQLAAEAFSVNLASIKSIYELRRIPSLKNKVCLNTLSHSRGAMHPKFIICGNENHSRSFIGGLDFAPFRLSSRRIHENLSHVTRVKWHDAGVKINGPVNQNVYDFFKDLWNEVVNRTPVVLKLNKQYLPSHVINASTRSGETSFDIAKSTIESSITPLTPTKVIVFDASGSEKIQLLRTIPKIGISAPSSTLPTNLINAFSPISFAQEGIFEFRVALKKAISQATKYIYIEDQGLCAWEAFKWINQRIISQPDLKVVLFVGNDPADTKTNLSPNSINGCLLKNLTPEQISRIYCWSPPFTVHSKIVIIDDKWASIGSANFFQRSLYTDGELSIGLVSDVSDTESQFSFAGQLRVQLILEYLETDRGFNPFDFTEELYDLDKWSQVWNGTHASDQLLSEFTRVSLPIMDVPPISAKEDIFIDTDPYHENFLSLIEILQVALKAGESPAFMNSERCK